MTSDNSTPQDENLQALPEVLIYVDGAAIPNPGNTGIGIVLLFGEHKREISKSTGRGTNNSSEILAAVEALKALKQPCSVTLYSDSQYLIRTMRGEVKRGANMALWHLLDAEAARHTIDWQWGRGHIGNRWNERADILANQAAQRTDAPLFDGINE